MTGNEDDPIRKDPSIVGVSESCKRVIDYLSEVLEKTEASIRQNNGKKSHSFIGLS